VIVVDSSGWLEFYMDGPQAGQFARFLKDTEALVTPTIVAYEVWKIARRQRGEQAARLCLGHMKKTLLVPLDIDLAVLAAELSLRHSLAMADSIVLATAQAHAAELVTKDPDFRKIPGVRLV
jgi:predicted nucleic acid-binding protein